MRREDRCPLNRAPNSTTSDSSGSWLDQLIGISGHPKTSFPVEFGNSHVPRGEKLPEKPWKQGYISESFTFNCIHNASHDRRGTRLTQKHLCTNTEVGGLGQTLPSPRDTVGFTMWHNRPLLYCIQTRHYTCTMRHTNSTLYLLLCSIQSPLYAFLLGGIQTLLYATYKVRSIPFTMRLLCGIQSPLYTFYYVAYKLYYAAYKLDPIPFTMRHTN